jgi:hypothetical protein
VIFASFPRWNSNSIRFTPEIHCEPSRKILLGEFRPRRSGRDAERNRGHGRKAVATEAGAGILPPDILADALQGDIGPGSDADSIIPDTGFDRAETNFEKGRLPDDGSRALPARGGIMIRLEQGLLSSRYRSSGPGGQLHFEVFGDQIDQDSLRPAEPPPLPTQEADDAPVAQFPDERQPGQVRNEIAVWDGGPESDGVAVTGDEGLNPLRADDQEQEIPSRLLE